MKWLSTIYQIARADTLERMRQYGFRVTLAVTVVAGYILVPAQEASYVVIRLGPYRGVYNSAWVGGTLAVMTTLVLSLLGFFLVRDNLERDRRTGVGRLIASSGINKGSYLAGKALSNFAILFVIVLAVMFTAIPMQRLRSPEYPLELVPLLTPFLWVTIPVISLIAGLALLFEAARPLRGAVGRLVFVGLWTMASVSGRSPLQGGSFPEPMGLHPVFQSMFRDCTAAFPNCLEAADQLQAAITSFPREGLQLFTWNGVDLTLTLLGSRLIWPLTAIILTVIAALLLDWRDLVPHGERRSSRQSSRDVVDEALPPPVPFTPTSLTPILYRPGLLSLVHAELRNAFRDTRWWWMAIAAGIGLAGLLSPHSVVRLWLLPLSFIWPLPLWSALGQRELRYRVEPVIFTATRPLTRHLLAIWLSGVCLTALIAVWAVFPMLRAGDWDGLLRLGIATLFVPTLALACGVWTGGQRLFETAYPLLWYLGPIEGAGPIDFLGARGAPPIAVYVAITAFLAALAVLGRRRQLLL